MAELITNIKLREDDNKEVIYSVREVNKEQDKRLHKKEHLFEYFACTCNGADRKYWKNQVNELIPDFDPDEHADISSQICMILAWDYDGRVSIAADQWFGVNVTAYLNSEDFTEYDTIKISMQCDEIDIGLLAALQILQKAIPNVD